MRRHCRLLLIPLGVCVALAATSVFAFGAVETSPSNSYTVDYTPDDGMTPLTAAEFPQLQAQNLATALSNTTAASPGNPSGLHNGYADQGFDAPDFGGSPRQTFVLDCSTIGGCDSGNASADRINMPAATYRTASEACMRGVIGHELFHHIEFEAIGFANWPTWGGDPVEGTARIMQDKLYNDLDDNAGCITYLAEVNNYLSDPSRSMWGLSYTTALFWNYLMERLGNDRAEPGVGTDFIREFWQNAQDAGSNRDFLGTLRTTITQFDKNATLEGLFHDFTVANYTKQMDVSALPDGAKYRYVDEQQPGAAAYDAVPVTDVGTLPPNVGPTGLSVNSWASRGSARSSRASTTPRTSTTASPAAPTRCRSRSRPRPGRPSSAPRPTRTASSSRSVSRVPVSSARRPSRVCVRATSRSASATWPETS